ncbi:MAG: sporulation protein YqfD, partial [Clostridia bacterium]
MIVIKLFDKVKNLGGIVTVEIEGFFTERFINLCKINNIKIWDIRNIVSGIIRFRMHICEFKKLKKVAKKTKCKVKIKEKKGAYFILFRYRKRKILVYLFALLIIISVLSTCFVWNINITGNNSISNEIILEKLKDSGIHVGKFKLGLNKNEVLKKLRSSIPEFSWIGMEVNGTYVDVKIVEKVVLNDKNKQSNVFGDIVSDKVGIISKIIPENGTAILKEGSYVENGTMLIEGKIYSKVLEPEVVHASGIVKIKSQYIFEKEYKYKNIIKVYYDKSKYNIGFSINNKEFYINYLKKELKYDKLKLSKNFNIFGNNVSFDLYTFNKYTENELTSN